VCVCFWKNKLISEIKWQSTANDKFGQLKKIYDSHLAGEISKVLTIKNHKS